MIKRSRPLYFVFSLGFAMSAIGEGAGVLNHEAYLRDVSAANAGLEIIQPFVSSDATHTYVNLRFEIYPVGATTKLYATQTATISMPPSPDTCDTLPSVRVYFDDMVFVSNNNILSAEIEWTCDTSPGGGWFIGRDIVFGANVSQAGGAMWLKQYPLDYNQAIFGPELDIVDVTGDGVAEVVLSATNSTDDISTVTFLNPATGAVVVPAKSRRYAWNLNFYR